MDSQPLDMMMDYLQRLGNDIARNRNEFKNHGESYNAYLAAQEQRKAMQTHLDGLMRIIEPAISQSAEVQRHLKAIQDGLITQQSNLDQLVRSVPPMARKPPNADELCKKLFSIPELLERILLFLSPAELLRVQQVNKGFFVATQASPKIQIKMGLRPADKCHINFPLTLCDFHHFSFYAETYTCFTTSQQDLKENEVTIKAGFYGGEKTPKLGSRCRNMLICQPPIKSFNVYTRCCHPTWSWRNSHEPVEVLKVESGIRMGDLMDTYERITAAHRLCPDADPQDHDDEGFVKPKVSFEARIVAQENDPALVERRANDKKRKDEDARWQSHGNRMRPYITAKQTARDNGEPIPTLAEFEKASRETDTLSEATFGGTP